MAGMRMRDHNKADLALAALTLSVAALAAGSEAVRWASGRLRRSHPSAESLPGTSNHRLGRTRRH
jgi:hypothetical protein